MDQTSIERPSVRTNSKQSTGAGVNHHQQGSGSPQKKPGSGIAPNIELNTQVNATLDDITDTVILNVRVSTAKNVRGTKGDRINSFVRVQFSDFDFKDSPVINDTSNPEYNFSFDMPLPLDEVFN
jgi:hypothetical protein